MSDIEKFFTIEEVANKTKKQTFIKCKKCGDEIFGCEDYVRIGGDKTDYEIIDK